MTQIDSGSERIRVPVYHPGNGSDGLRPPSTPSTPEGRFLAGPGKPLSRHATEMNEQKVAARVRAQGAAAALDHAASMASERAARHRGGERPWPLRLAIPLAVTAEAVTGFVAMEVLVSSTALATGLAVLAALVGAGTAGIIANRRLNQLPVPAWARIGEVIFVSVLTLLRFDSLYTQSPDLTAAAGGAVLAALISAIALLAIEEVVVETDTFSVFLGRLAVRYRRWQRARAAARLARLQARAEAAGQKFQRHFVDFLLKAEGFPLPEGQQRAAALAAARCPKDGG